MFMKHANDDIDLAQFQPLKAAIDEHNRKDREAIARAQSERKKWLEEKRNGSKVDNTAC